jgi:hypothetical protein
VQVLEGDKPRVAKPEEIVRQLVVASLITIYGYQPHHIKLEHVIPMGINRPRADICIFNKQGQIIEIIEIKVFKPKEAKAISARREPEPKKFEGEAFDDDIPFN